MKNNDTLPKGTYTAEIYYMALEASKEDREPIVWVVFGTEEREDINIHIGTKITQGTHIAEVNKFLSFLKTDINIEFKNYKQYNKLILKVFEVCKDTKFKIEYDPYKFGFEAVKILEVL